MKISGVKSVDGMDGCIDGQYNFILYKSEFAIEVKDCEHILVTNFKYCRAYGTLKQKIIASYHALLYIWR